MDTVNSLDPAPFMPGPPHWRKFLNTRTFMEPSSTAYVFESPAQAKALPFPNALLRYASAV